MHAPHWLMHACTAWIAQWYNRLMNAVTAWAVLIWFHLITPFMLSKIVRRDWNPGPSKITCKSPWIDPPFCLPGISRWRRDKTCFGWRVHGTVQSVTLSVKWGWDYIINYIQHYKIILWNCIITIFMMLTSSVVIGMLPPRPWFSMQVEPTSQLLY